MNNREKNLPKMVFVAIILCSTIFGISFSLINNDTPTTTEKTENYDNQELIKKDQVKIYVPNENEKIPKIKKPAPPQKKPATITGLLKLGEFNGAIDNKTKIKEIRHENYKK